MADRLPLFTSEQGIVHSFEDHGEGSFTIHSTQDVEPLLDLNKAMANHNDGLARRAPSSSVPGFPPIRAQ